MLPRQLQYACIILEALGATPQMHSTAAKLLSENTLRAFVPQWLQRMDVEAHTQSSYISPPRTSRSLLLTWSSPVIQCVGALDGNYFFVMSVLFVVAFPSCFLVCFHLLFFVVCICFDQRRPRQPFGRCMESRCQFTFLPTVLSHYRRTS
jgi:hypothetical protein